MVGSEGEVDEVAVAVEKDSISDEVDARGCCCCRRVYVEDDGDDRELDDEPGDDVDGGEGGATRTWIENCAPFLFRRRRR